MTASSHASRTRDEIVRSRQVLGSLRAVPQNVVDKGIVLSDSGLLNSIRVVGGPGSGKSRLVSRAIVMQRLIRGKPTLCIDPTGAIFANVCDVISRQPADRQELLWSRIRYVDMAADDYVVPMPLYFHRSQSEYLSTTANRFVEVIQRLDPHLRTASIEGWNAVVEAGTAAGMMGTALGLQLPEIDNMLRHPESWKRQFKSAYRNNPEELQPAFDYFQDLKSTHNPALRKRRTGSFLIKLIPFLVDPVMKATFAADRPGIDLAREMADGHLVIYDFQGEIDPTRRRMKLLWIFRDGVEFAKSRGQAGREQPVLDVIDETPQLLGQSSDEQALMANDFNELTTVVARNFGFPVCVVSQNISQIEEKTQVALSQIGNQIVGWLQEPDDCLRLARQFFRYNPHLVRKREPVWMNVQQTTWPVPVSAPTIIDETTTEYGIEEQQYLLADRFRTLGRFRFLVRLAEAEGSLSEHLRPMSIERLHSGQFPDHELVDDARRRLRKRDGIAVDVLLRQIEERRQESISVQKPRPQRAQTADGTIDTDLPTHAEPVDDNLPEPVPADSEAADSAPQEPGVDTGATDEAWKDALFSRTQQPEVAAG